MTEPRKTLAEVGDRDFDIVEAGVCYRLSAPGVNVTLEVDRLLWQRNELTGELMVRCDVLGTDWPVGPDDKPTHVAAFNLSSARARAERAGLLARSSRTPELPWQGLLEDLCQRVLAAERLGTPAVALREIERPSVESNSVIHLFGFALPRLHGSVIFGDGGATKSLLALWLAGRLAEEGYRVALFDWELEGVDHRERFETLFGADMPATVFYTRCARPLVYEADRLKRIVRDQGIDFAFYDSIGFACHAKPEDADSALAYNRAVRQIGVGSVHVAHINKGEHGDQKPFGSAFWHNSARATWFVKASDETPAAGISVGVFCRKHNLLRTGKQQPFAYEVRQEGERTRFGLTDIAAVSDLALQVPISQRIRSLLRAGAKTREQIAAEWPDEKPETLRRVINREIERGRLVRFPGANGIEQIGLKAKSA